MWGVLAEHTGVQFIHLSLENPIKINTRNIRHHGGKRIPDNDARKMGDTMMKIKHLWCQAGNNIRILGGKELITKHHPYGWVQWYCDFYNGERGPDDEETNKPVAQKLQVQRVDLESSDEFNQKKCIL